MLRVMDADEYADWMTLESIDPFGQRRDDLRSAKLALAILAALGARHGTDHKPYGLTDVLLQFDVDAEDEQVGLSSDAIEAAMTIEEREQRQVKRLERDLKVWAAAINARFGRRADGQFFDEEPDGGTQSG